MAADLAPIAPGSDLSFSLQGRTAVVTGGASGIGAAIATAFVERGATVAVVDRNLPAARERAEQLGEGAFALECDVTDPASTRATTDAVVERTGRLDVLVNCAGLALLGTAESLPFETWQTTLSVNLTGTFLTLKHAVRALSDRGGSIVVTGSPTGLNGEGRDFTAYSSSKAGVHGLVRTVAAAYADRGIRVNTVVPGYTETPLVTTISQDAASRAAIVGRTPLGRPGTPQDVVGVMVHLAGDESSFSTGAIFRVDGGMTSL